MTRFDTAITSRPRPGWSGASATVRLFGAAVLALNLAVGALIALAPTERVPVSAGAIAPEAGHNFVATVDVPAPFPYIFAPDSAADGQRADATVLEDGRPLGPQHAMHDTIRSKGGGSLSFWSGSIYFSTSDNSDPRTNGRTYAARVQLELPRRVTLGLLALDVVAALLLRRILCHLIARYRDILLGIVVIALAARFLVAAEGWAPSLFASSPSTVDPAMAWAILSHIALGFGLAAVTYAIGVGTLLWAGQDRTGTTDILLRAFLPGTIILAVAALLTIAAPGGVVVAGFVCLGAMAPLVRYRAHPDALRSVGSTMTLVGPVIALYAIVLSFRYHGPSSSIPGGPLGDETIYVGWANMLLQHLAPVYNFGMEGDRATYGNLLPSLFMAPLISLKWFDPYLFLSASLPVFSLASFSATLPLSRASQGLQHRPVPTALDHTLFACLLGCSFRFPSILVESPPFAFLLPVLVSAYHLARTGYSGPSRPWQAVLTAGIGTAISKVVSFLVLMPLSLPDIAGHLLRKASRRQRIIAAALGACALGYIVLALHTYVSVYLAVGTLGPLSWDEIVRQHTTDPLRLACVLGRDIGAVVLAIAVARSSSLGLKLGIWLGVASALFMPFLFHTSLTTAVLLVAIVVWAAPRAESVSRPTALAAGLMMLPYTAVFDWGGQSIVLGWWAFVATMTWLLARQGSEKVKAGASPQRSVAAMACLVIALSAVCLWGAAAGALHVGRDDFAFTPDMRDIWLAVKRDTPRDALLFTDQTGNTEDRRDGWNDYALAGQRQFYLVSWVMSPLRIDAARRRVWLDRNAAVLSGALSPEALTLSRRYDGFYAVLDARKTAPRGFVPVYRNPSFALYRIAPHSGGEYGP